MVWRLGVVITLLTLSTLVPSAQTIPPKSKLPVQFKIAAVEVFEIIELPLSIRNVRLLKTDRGYLLQGVLSNSTDEEMTGLRYSLVETDSLKSRLMTNRIEGFKLAAYSSREFTFQTPLKLRWKEGMRLVLMLEQVVSSHDIWEVVKAKEALDAYIAADYSVIPKVIHASNQTDAPILPGRLIIP